MPEIAWQYSTIYSYGEKQLVEGIPLSNSTEVAIYAIVITRKLQQSGVYVSVTFNLLFSFLTRFDDFFFFFFRNSFLLALKMNNLH